MNRFEKILKQLLAWWDKTTLNQKIVIIISSMAGLAMAAGLIYWATLPDYTVLYSKLSPQDADAIVGYLKDNKIPYRLGAGGGTIEVPGKTIYETRLELAGKGLPKGEGVGYEIFDKMSFGVTDEVQQINFLRALQNELERTIDSLDVIEKSRVHLVIPKEDGWFQEKFKPTASVMVRLTTSGTLLPRQVSSIRHLLASAVSGLTPENVTIVDTSGDVLSAAGDDDGSNVNDRQIDYKAKVEKALKEKAESLLFKIVGPNKAAVQVYAVVDFDQTQREQERFTPVVGKNGLVRSEKRNSVTPIKTSNQSGGAAGTASNLQGYPPAGMLRHQASRKSEQQVNYEMNRTVERTTSASGQIKKLSVGIFIDGNMKEEQLSAIKGVVETALGIDLKRGDQIEVKALPFSSRNTEEEKNLLEKSQREKFIMNIVTKWAPRTLLVLVGISFLFLSVRNMNKMAAAAGRSAESEDDGPPLRGRKFDPNKFIGTIKDNPDETAKVLKNWLS